MAQVAVLGHAGASLRRENLPADALVQVLRREMGKEAAGRPVPKAHASGITRRTHARYVGVYAGACAGAASARSAALEPAYVFASADLLPLREQFACQRPAGPGAAAVFAAFSTTTAHTFTIVRVPPQRAGFDALWYPQRGGGRVPPVHCADARLGDGAAVGARLPGAQPARDA
mgnify:CR=1 FL=1